MGAQDRPAVPTMADVAARAGVSRALVSIVFRGVPGAGPETTERVMRAAEELSYRPDQRARLLGSKRSRTLGVVFGLHQEFHAELVERLYEAVEERGYTLALGVTAPSRAESRAVAALLEYRCEALILLGPTTRTADLEELAARLPVVVVARSLPSRKVNVVRTDDVAGSRLAVHHLGSLGHRAIAHVDGGRAPGAAERRRGYRAAMLELDLGAHLRILPGGPSEEAGEAVATRLLESSGPTAVVAFNDHCAAGLMSAARSRGVSIPDELSIVGYDNSHIAGLSSVALTTVAQDSYALAAAARDLVLAALEGDSGRASEVVVPPELVIRNSSSAP